MKSELWALVFLLPACSSQVSLGSQDDNTPAVSSQPEASTMDASAPMFEAAVEANAPSVGDAHHAVDGSSDAAPYDPCAGKACGVACTVCSPHDVQCVEPPGSKQCNPHQECVTALLCP